jgi:hypothetical protein
LKKYVVVDGTTTPSPSNEREGVDHHIALGIHATEPQVFASNILHLTLSQPTQDTVRRDDVGVLHHLTKNRHRPTIRGATRDRLALATILVDLARVVVSNAINEHRQISYPLKGGASLDYTTIIHPKSTKVNPFS